MEIWVSYDGQQFKFTPDRARVKVGTPVIWRFQADQLRIASTRWTVFFQKGSPFLVKSNEFSTTTSNDLGQQTGATEPLIADTPGDYKYGVRAEDAATQVLLGEDDPYLIVTL